VRGRARDVSVVLRVLRDFARRLRRNFGLAFARLRIAAARCFGLCLRFVFDRASSTAACVGASPRTFAAMSK
jgi:hypothetical protein